NGRNTVQKTGSEKVSFTVIDPTSPAADTSAGGIVSGGVAVADRVWGPAAISPAASRSSRWPDAVSVTATSEPTGGGPWTNRLALATPLSAATLQIGMVSPKTGSLIALRLTCHVVWLKSATRHTGLLNVTVTTFPATVTPV